MDNQISRELVPKPKPQPERRPLVHDDARARWYDYALARLPLSLLISLITLLFGVPILIWLILSIYATFAG